MFGRLREKSASVPHAAAAPWVADPSVPARACCCPGRPVVKVVLLPTPSRRRQVDLWLCGHHYRLSRAALDASGALVEELPTESPESPDRAAAIVL